MKDKTHLRAVIAPVFLNQIHSNSNNEGLKDIRSSEEQDSRIVSVPVDKQLLQDIHSHSLNTGVDSTVFFSNDINKKSNQIAQNTFNNSLVLAKASRQLAIDHSNAVLDLKGLISSSQSILNNDRIIVNTLLQDLQSINHSLNLLENAIYNL